MTRAAAAVHRALDARHRGATAEVERILAAAVQVMAQAAPDAPRVSDIVAAAGSSNKAFYRYFAGKDDLLLAVMERGVGIVVSYLRHELAKEATPADQVARWIRGTLAQVSDPHLLSLSRAASLQLTATTDRRLSDGAIPDMLLPLRELLDEPVAALGGSDPRRDADTVFTCTLATMRRYLGSAEQPQPADADHLVSFCLRALGA